MPTNTRSYREYPSRRPRRRGSRKTPLLILLALAAIAGSGVVAVAALWPAARIVADARALAGVKLAPVGEHVTGVSVTDPAGREVRVDLRAGAIWPVGKLRSGERLEVRVTVARSSLVSWLVGKTKQVSTTIVTPQTHLGSTLLHLAPGAPLVLRFDAPVAVVRFKLPGYNEEHLTFRNPRAVVPTGLLTTGPSRAGVLTVAAAARAWEIVPEPVRVSWFPAGQTLQALVKPAPGTTIDPAAGIELVFSEPVAGVFGVTRPKLDPPTPGRWQLVAPNALRFVPAEPGFALGRRVTVTLPVPTAVITGGRAETHQTLTWSVPVGSTLRLHQLLAGLGYLPLAWHPTGGAPPTTALAEARAALDPPDGTFTWRYPGTPRHLRSLWREDGWTRMTQGAVMAFQHDHHLVVDGIPGPLFWHSLIAAARSGETGHSYSYVLVHRNVPQNLVLWNNGKTVLQARINTGVPAAPTPLGTHAVFEHIPVGTMRGRNPDGSHYVDPGILWISYFYGGEAIHGFDRPTYGFPQSVGCVEAPNATAKKIWPYTPIGTLVSIVP